MATVGVQMRDLSFPGVSNRINGRQDTNGIGKGGFSSVFDQSIQSRSKVPQKNIANDKKDFTDVEGTSNISSNSKKMKADQINDVVEPENDTTDEKTTVDDAMALYAMLNDLGDQIKQILFDQLGMSADEFEQVLEELGMTMVDLLDPNQLTNFFFQVNDVSDSSELLTNETLANNLKDLMAKVDQITSIEQTGFTKEEMVTILENLKQSDLSGIQEEQSTADSLTNDQQTEKTFEDKEAVQGTTLEIEVDDDSESSTNHDLSDNHSLKKQTSDQIDFSVNGSIEASKQTKIDFFDQLAPTSQAKEIVEQLVKEIKVQIRPDQTSMEMVLTPETLGRVNLHVSSNDGVMIAHLVTESELAKEAIESQLSTLKETFQNQGLVVESVEVTVATNNFDFLNQSQTRQQEEQENQSNLRKLNRKRITTEELLEDESNQNATDSINVSIGKGTQIDMLA